MSPARRIVHTVTVGPRSGRVYREKDGTFTVAHLWEGKKVHNGPSVHASRADACKAARRYAWEGQEALRIALQAYAQMHVGWKAQLARYWAAGWDQGPLLNQARDTLGPEWLKTITTADLEG